MRVCMVRHSLAFPSQKSARFYWVHLRLSHRIESQTDKRFAVTKGCGFWTLLPNNQDKLQDKNIKMFYFLTPNFRVMIRVNKYLSYGSLIINV